MDDYGKGKREKNSLRQYASNKMQHIQMNQIMNSTSVIVQ